ncbi:DUF6887 family protein [Dactylococcopsis salina]|uniref:Uncharacterized protein n=1 Tax=Dactylococcopsis salina (strain PCC 8305) TaxID=13035 RepID=K9YQR2_DACS8|nr:hypothetical protein [Dactylococcopsis salina]AFZ49256.1 hypothetical protein Dacsa_0469 [Dactylococcopsis salina PCC 8305]
MTSQLERMTREQVRDYLRHNPADDQAWEIFFQKLDESPKQKISSIQEFNQLLKEKTNPNQ